MYYKPPADRQLAAMIHHARPDLSHCITGECAAEVRVENCIAAEGRGFGYKRPMRIRTVGMDASSTASKHPICRFIDFFDLGRLEFRSKGLVG